MSLTAALATFAAILPGEIPDKTIFACLILSSRYRPFPVFAGAAAAFALHVVLAVAVGGALALLPQRWILTATTAVFLVGALLLWRHKAEQDDEETGKGLPDSFWPVAAAAFGVIFVAEFGDLTQIMTVTLAARFHDPVGVGVGATLGLWTAAGLAVVIGWRLLRLIKVEWLTRIAAVVMLTLACTSGLAAAGVNVPLLGASPASPTATR